MKKIFAYSMTIASAAILFSACQATDLKVSVAEQDGVKVTIKAAAETRTALDTTDPDDIHSVWNNGDALGVWAGEVSGAPAKFTNSAADNDAAVFSGTIPEFSGKTKLFASYPYKKSAAVNFPANQTMPSVGTYDPNSEVLLGKPIEINEGADGTIANMQFARVSSAVKLVFNGTLPAGVADTEVLKKVIFSAGPEVIAANQPEGKVFLTGTIPFTADGQFADDWTGAANRVTVTAPAGMTLANAELYFSTAPAVIPGGTDVVFEIFTDVHYIRKTLTTSSDITLASGTLNTLKMSWSGSVSVSGAPEITLVDDCTEKTPWEDPVGDKYTATLKGKYEAQNASEFNRVTCFFYYKINGAAKKTSTLSYSEKNEESFYFPIEGLNKNDRVEYQVVARFGEVSTNNVQYPAGDSWLSFTVDPSTVLAEWNPTAAATKPVATTNVNYGSTSDDSSYMSYSGTNIKAPKIGLVQLGGLTEGNCLTIVVPVSKYSKTDEYRLTFSSLYVNKEATRTATFTSSVNNRDYINSQDIDIAKSAESVSYDFSFGEQEEAVSNIYIKFTLTSTIGSGSTLNLGVVTVYKM